MAFVFCPLRSGSSGNALFVQAGRTRVLVDAGLSGRTTEALLCQIGASPDTLAAILVSHEHSDHIQGVGVLSRRYDVPVFATEGTWRAMEQKPGISGIALKNRRALSEDASFYIDDLGVTPFSIPHDAAEPVGFSLYFGGRKLCVATDLGHIEKRWLQALSGANLVLLESNHDHAMLSTSARYPATLKRRILGRTGHLSNDDCGKALLALAKEGLRHVILGHMSAETNTPELALQTVCEALLAEGIRPNDDIRVDLARRDRLGDVYHL